MCGPCFQKLMVTEKRWAASRSLGSWLESFVFHCLIQSFIHHLNLPNNHIEFFLFKAQTIGTLSNWSNRSIYFPIGLPLHQHQQCKPVAAPVNKKSLTLLTHPILTRWHTALTLFSRITLNNECDERCHRSRNRYSLEYTLITLCTHLHTHLHLSFPLSSAINADTPTII